VQAATFYRKKTAAAAFVNATPARKESAMTRHALDQSNRYADVSWDEEQPIKNGKHVLVAYIGYEYLATAAHFAAESPPRTNKVCTTDDFAKSVDAVVHYIYPANEERRRLRRSNAFPHVPQEFWPDLP
jgi:hypothetical protein